MMMQDKHYLGDGFYPAIIDKNMFQAVEEERQRRSRRLGRDKPKMERGDCHMTPTRFLFKSAMKTYGDPYKQAEYIYSLIESEA